MLRSRFAIPLYKVETQFGVGSSTNKYALKQSCSTPATKTLQTNIKDIFI